MVEMTIRELIEELEKDGYRLTESRIRKYVQMGLLSPASKVGGPRRGVRLVFQDGDKQKEKVKEICELRGKGYSLPEILTLFKEREYKEIKTRHKAFLDRYIEIHGQTFLQLEIRPKSWDTDYADEFQLGDSLVACFEESDEYKSRFISSIGVSASAINEALEIIEKRQLVTCIYMWKDQKVYSREEMDNTFGWLNLYFKEDLDWETLEALFRRGKRNSELLMHFPDVDGIRFTDTFLRWGLRRDLNEIGSRLFGYVEKIRNGFPLFEYAYGELKVENDTEYKTVKEFIDDFLQGKCAWVCGWDYYCEHSVFLKCFKQPIDEIFKR